MRKASRNLAVGILAALLLPVTAVSAEAIEVRVLGPDGSPVRDVVVFVEGADADSNPAAVEAAVMDQVDKQFLPHILVVRKGTPVTFPNSDPVAHHVYSFSRPNAFTLPLYKGNPHDPITFEHDGVVTLGCNIHDNMLGYIVVVDTPVFAKTNGEGTATLATDYAGDARISVWSPRIRDDMDSLEALVDASNLPSSVTIRLARTLRPAHDADVDALSWSEY